MRYDVYCLDAVTKRVVGLTDGIAAVDSGSAAAQAARQRAFPTSVIHAMYATRVQEGAISLPSDKCHLLNAITGCEDLDEPPAVNHDRYHHLNMLHLKCAVHLAIGASLAGGTEERAKILKVLSLSTIDQIELSFLHGDAPAPYVTDRLMADFFLSIPESLWSLKLAHPLPYLPADLDSHSNLRRIRTLDLTNSIHLVSLPDWLRELPQLDTLLLRNCRSLRHLTSNLLSIYNKYKNMVVDLTGCAKLFKGLKPGPGPGAASAAELEPTYTPFREATEMEYVRELFTRAVVDLALDQLVVHDGCGTPFRSSSDLKLAEA